MIVFRVVLEVFIEVDVWMGGWVGFFSCAVVVIVFWMFSFCLRFRIVLRGVSQRFCFFLVVEIFLSGGLGLVGWVVPCCLYSCGLPFLSFSELSIGGWSGLQWAGLLMYLCVLYWFSVIVLNIPWVMGGRACIFACSFFCCVIVYFDDFLLCF